ncbi:zinc dependent phospholipase C family protein [Candidatus Leptofilum sp.]|uniref:zinc dependent phospholipase C family protein n=1 Tax=Candidatus Leptofilum sp. TaxID=3241576 RepID=UPI003B590CB7
MHLHTAELILDTVKVNGNGRLHQTLSADWPAFYLGSVAPDVNAISSLRRVSTHFYDVPPAPEETAYGSMLAQYPQLTDFVAMPLEQAVCVAAYSAHLMLDLIWLREVVYPFFFKADHLGDRKQRELTHFILLTYLDLIAVEALPATAVTTLAAAQPHCWLPFVDDSILIAWRDMLTEQLSPGAAIRTVEIYAGRLKMSPTEFAANLKDPDWMKAQVFDKIPVGEVQQILQTAVPRSIELIQNYLP